MCKLLQVTHHNEGKEVEKVSVKDEWSASEGCREKKSALSVFAANNVQNYPCMTFICMFTVSHYLTHTYDGEIPLVTHYVNTM